jgi:hypothetical protein
MLIPFEWEIICNTDTSQTSRAKVPFGWLVLTMVNGRTNITTPTVFVADPDHSWTVKPEEQASI